MFYQKCHDEADCGRDLAWRSPPRWRRAGWRGAAVDVEDEKADGIECSKPPPHRSRVLTVEASG